MGLFGKIKQNIQHGGVKVKLDSPGSVSLSDATLPVSVTVTATDGNAQINSVKVELQATTQNLAFNSPGSGNTAANTAPQTQVVARAVNTQPFTLAPGQSQTVQLAITMNVGAAAEAQAVPAMPAQLAHALGNLETLAGTLNHNSYRYRVEAVADVDGVGFDPSDSRPIAVNKPGQFGSAGQFEARL